MKIEEFPTFWIFREAKCGEFKLVSENAIWTVSQVLIFDLGNFQHSYNLVEIRLLLCFVYSKGIEVIQIQILGPKMWQKWQFLNLKESDLQFWLIFQEAQIANFW